jgi:hypothetical protein
MTLGTMYWDDNSKTTLQQKVETAVGEYKTKWQKSPTTCFVNQKALEPLTEIEVAGVIVKSMKFILPDHLWIGIEESKK